MIRVRKSEERGTYDHGWLKTAHTFSFADYYDPEFMGFRSLRVINEDVVLPDHGFGKHPHRNMEIITYVLRGALTHSDSMGHSAPIIPGEIQYMSAGKGIFHGEANTSHDEPVHLLQIWIEPSETGGEPRYEQRAIPLEKKQNRLALLVTGEKSEEAIQIKQDAKLFASILLAGKELEYSLKQDRFAWIQVARGDLSVNGTLLKAGDGAAISAETALKIAGVSDSEFLLFDLA